jgi:hypothetical protein
MRPRVITALLFLSSLVPCAASAQDSKWNCNEHPAVCAYQKPLTELAAAKKAGNQQAVQDRLLELLNPGTNSVLLVDALTPGTGFTGFVNSWEKARLDKQVGAPATGSGTTDLVSRPSTPELLGLGVQLGALTETVSGSTATFNANAEGAYRAIIGKPVVCLACADTFWRGLNFSASFDLSAQGTKQVPTSGAANPATPDPAMVQLPQSSRQFSSATARYDIYNPLDPRSPEFQKAWTTAYEKHQPELADAAERLRSAVNEILKPLDADQEIVALENSSGPTLEAAAAGTVDQLNGAFEKFFNALVALARKDIPDLDAKVVNAAGAFSYYAQLNYAAVQEARGKPQFTAQYTYNRPMSQPETHDFKLILGLSPGASGALFTLNLAGTLYGGQIPSGAKYGRVRDFQFAAQFDRPLGNVMTHPATLTLAGYIQYQFDPSVLNIGPGNLAPGTNIMLPQNAQVLLGTKGTLAILQAKVTLNTKSGVNIPLAVSWANKTDLLKANEVRGNVGITYDFNSIAQAFGGGQ